MGPNSVELTSSASGAIRKVRSLATGTDLATSSRDGKLTVEVPGILLHEVLILE